MSAKKALYQIDSRLEGSIHNRHNLHQLSSIKSKMTDAEEIKGYERWNR